MSPRGRKGNQAEASWRSDGYTIEAAALKQREMPGGNPSLPARADRYGPAYPHHLDEDFEGAGNG